jgi:flagellar biosynthesis protein FliR
MATLIDPESGEAIHPLGRLYGLLALAVFLALNGPLLLVRALVESFQTVPAGRMLFTVDTVTTAMTQLGRVLELGLRAAAPAALALALAGIAVGWLGRAAPSLPFTALALPLRSLTGIALVLLSAAALAATFTAAWTALLKP